ncbi:hypothetical protein CPB84DRAFT_1761394 [Gymnopilus junonius]|uniref:Secreted protein n=1 Tax=Gymnopilus junonius TaxID=109634 RepID=A0A9P5P158_GYMJU|nr:hypothetical protein CPB84DRAFT_1761394 [Gymnopilus junonius]
MDLALLLLLFLLSNRRFVELLEVDYDIYTFFCGILIPYFSHHRLQCNAVDFSIAPITDENVNPGWQSFSSPFRLILHFFRRP